MTERINFQRMDDSLIQETEKEIKKNVKKSKATIEGLRLEISIWENAYKTQSVKHAERMKKMLEEYNKREKAIIEKNEKEKQRVLENLNALRNTVDQGEEYFSQNFEPERGFEDTIHFLKEGLENHVEGHEHLKRVIHFVISEISNIKKHKDSKDKEINKLRTSRNEGFRELQKRIEILKHKNLEKDEKIGTLNNKLEIALVNNSNFQRKLAGSKEKALQLEQKLNSHEEKIYNQKQIITKLHKEIGVNRNENLSLLHQTKNLQDDYTQVKENENQKAEKINHLNSKILKIKDQYHQALVELKKREGDLELLRSQIMNEEKIGEEQKKEIVQLKNTTHKMELEMIELQKNKKVSNEKMGNIKTIIGDAEKMIDLQKNKIAKLEEENQIVSKKFEETEELLSKEKEGRKVSDSKHHQEIQLIQAEAKERILKEVGECNKRIEVLQEEIKQNKSIEVEIKKMASQKHQILEKRIMYLEKEKNHVETTHEKKTKDQKAQLLDLQKQVNSMDNAFEGEKKKMAKIQKQYETEIETLRKENFELREKLIEFSKNAAIEKSHEQERLEQTKRIQRKLKRAEREKEKEQEFMNDEISVIDQLIEERDHYKTLLNESKKRLKDSNRAELTKLRNEYHKMTKKYQFVKDKYFKQSLRQNELQNTLLRMNRFRTLIGDSDVVLASNNDGSLKLVNTIGPGANLGIQQPSLRKRKKRTGLRGARSQRFSRRNIGSSTILNKSSFPKKMKKSRKGTRSKTPNSFVANRGGSSRSKLYLNF